ncbi:MAG TPA: cell division protein ZapD [Burkholderiaceae bacterium]|nr:cell division protein ZapD [Burkholderiaceae bacterium]
MILYEYPFQESVRTMLRLEQLFDRIGQLMVRDSALDHHFALVTLFEIMDVASRADLKSDLLKELERHKQQLLSLRGNAQVAQETLDEVVRRIEQAFDALNQLPGKAGHALTSNEWLMSVRSRISIPGGTCEFDLPAYYAWQHRDAAARRADLAQWVSTMMPLAQALQALLQLLRESGVRQKVVATGGQFQQSLAAGKIYQLLRLRLDPALQLIPEISGHRLMVSVRMMRAEADGRLRPSHDDASFELALCA